MNLMRGIDLKKIAEKMNGASGAELKVSSSHVISLYEQVQVLVPYCTDFLTPLI